MKPCQIRNSRVLFAAVCTLCIYPPHVRAVELYFIDAHSQVDREVGDPDIIIRRMDENGVHHTILAARSRRRPEEVAKLARKYPGRITSSVRTKSRKYINNSPAYYNKMHKQLASGDFRAMAEVLLYHAQKGDRAPEVMVYPEDERVQFALQEAKARGWPFVIHIEFRSLEGRTRERFMLSMKQMMLSHQDHPFVLIHMGQLNPAEVESLIDDHENIHFMTSHANPVFIRHSGQPWTNMFSGDRLSDAWKQLITRYPDRFIFALDNVWDRHWHELYAEQMRYWRKALQDLPAPVAQAVAHGNARRLWKLPEKASSQYHAP